MKKLFFASFLIGASLISYSQSSELVIKATTDQLTDLSEKVGISSFSVTNKNEHYDFTVSAGELLISNENYLIDGKKFSVDENKQTILLSYQGVNLTYIKSTKEIVINTKALNSISLANYNPIKLDKETANNISMAIIFLKEITDKSSARAPQLTNKVAGGTKHGMWVTYNGGASQSTSVLNTQAEVNTFLHNNPNCHLYGTINTHCLFSELVCVSSQHYMCN